MEFNKRSRQSEQSEQSKKTMIAVVVVPVVVMILVAMFQDPLSSLGNWLLYVIRSGMRDSQQTINFTLLQGIGYIVVAVGSLAFFITYMVSRNRDCERAIIISIIFMGIGLLGLGVVAWINSSTFFGISVVILGVCTLLTIRLEDGDESSVATLLLEVLFLSMFAFSHGFIFAGITIVGAISLTLIPVSSKLFEDEQRIGWLVGVLSFASVIVLHTGILTIQSAY